MTAAVTLSWISAGPARAPERRRTPRQKPRATLRAVQKPVSLWAVSCYICSAIGPCSANPARALVPAKTSGFRWTVVGGLGGWLCPACRVELDAMLLPPATRADCVDGPRPCDRIRCKWNLWFDVSRKADSEFSVLETCALDVADKGAHTYEQIGEILGQTREGARGVAEVALAKLRVTAGFDFDVEEDEAGE